MTESTKIDYEKIAAESQFAAHTPGPWEDNGEGLIYGQVSGIDDEAPFVADVSYESVNFLTNQEKANSLLICASTDMLAELLRTQDELASIIRDTNLKNLGHVEKDMLTRWFNGVTATIHKARGV